MMVDTCVGYQRLDRSELRGKRNLPASGVGNRVLEWEGLDGRDHQCLHFIKTYTLFHKRSCHQSKALVLFTLTSTVLTIPSVASYGNLAFGVTGDSADPPTESKDEYFMTRR